VTESPGRPRLTIQMLRSTVPYHKQLRLVLLGTRGIVLVVTFGSFFDGGRIQLDATQRVVVTGVIPAFRFDPGVLHALLSS
jgi:hypothetical protein